MTGAPLQILTISGSLQERSANTGPVRRLRAAFASADGVLLATPEYGHSMPGLLKTALDWLVQSGELSGMRVGLMSASPTMGGGIGAQMAPTRTLMAQAALVAVSLTVPGARPSWTSTAS